MSDATHPSSRGDRRRQRERAIVDAAARLAERGGLDAVKLRDVAAGAGVSMGALYRCFDSKEDILVQAFSDDFSSLERHMAAHPAAGETPLERVESFFRTASRGLVARPHYARAVLASTASGHQKAARQMATLHARTSHLIHAALVGAKDEPTSLAARTTDEDLSLVAQALNRVWFASLVAWAGGVHPAEDIIVETRRTAELLLLGAAAKV